MPVRVVTDSVSSIPPATASNLNIAVVDLFVNEDGVLTADSDLDQDTFFARLAQMPTLPTSSQPSIESLVTAFTDAVRDGFDVAGVFISSKMSGTCETARLAARMVTEQLPDAVIEIVDSGSNSMQEGFAAIAAARSAAAGAAIDACVRSAMETASKTRYLFSPASLDYLRKGGRIGTASALVGQLLQVKPILTVRNGQTETFSKVRTTGKALAEMARTFADDVAAHGLAEVVVHYIGDRDPAQRFATEQIEPIAGRAVEVVPVSAVIGVHVGPAVGIVYQTATDLT